MAESKDEIVHRHRVMNYMRQLLRPRDDETRQKLIALLVKERARAKAAGWTPLIP